jgi:hypothetical protein
LSPWASCCWVTCLRSLQVCCCVSVMELNLIVVASPMTLKNPVLMSQCNTWMGLIVTAVSLSRWHQLRRVPVLTSYHSLSSPDRCSPETMPPSPRCAFSEHHRVMRMAHVFPHCVRSSCPIEAETAKPDQHPRNYSWAELLHRVFAIDVLACPECGGRMRMLSAVHSPGAIRAILECLGLPARSPPVSPADADDSLFNSFEAC